MNEKKRLPSKLTDDLYLTALRRAQLSLSTAINFAANDEQRRVARRLFAQVELAIKNIQVKT